MSSYCECRHTWREHSFRDDSEMEMDEGECLVVCCADECDCTFYEQVPLYIIDRGYD